MGRNRSILRWGVLELPARENKRINSNTTFFPHSKNKADLKVTVGALSLITPDPEEQIITVFGINPYPTFEPVTKLHDIALLEVCFCNITLNESWKFNLSLLNWYFQLSRPIVFGITAQAIRYDEIDELATPWVAAIVGWGATVVGL